MTVKARLITLVFTSLLLSIKMNGATYDLSATIFAYSASPVNELFYDEITDTFYTIEEGEEFIIKPHWQEKTLPLMKFENILSFINQGGRFQIIQSGNEFFIRMRSLAKGGTKTYCSQSQSKNSDGSWTTSGTCISDHGGGKTTTTSSNVTCKSETSTNSDGAKETKTSCSVGTTTTQKG